jgi:hypothetical protein
MVELERHELAELRLSLAFLKMQLVLLRLWREERANPRWYLQPRVPANNPRGGQWTDAVLPALGQLLRLMPGAVAALRKVARGVRGWLSRPPRRWSGRPSEERDFDDETQRIGRPTERRPEHAQLRFAPSASSRKLSALPAKTMSGTTSWSNGSPTMGAFSRRRSTTPTTSSGCPATCIYA